MEMKKSPQSTCNGKPFAWREMEKTSQKDPDFVINPFAECFSWKWRNPHRAHAMGNRSLGEREDRDLGYCQNFANERIRTKSQGLVTEQEFHSDDRDLRELLERRARQAIMGENSAQRKLHSTEYDLEIKDLERRNSEYALIESQRELESQR